MALHLQAGGTGRLPVAKDYPLLTQTFVSVSDTTLRTHSAYQKAPSSWEENKWFYVEWATHIDTWLGTRSNSGTDEVDALSVSEHPTSAQASVPFQRKSTQPQISTTEVGKCHGRLVSAILPSCYIK